MIKMPPPGHPLREHLCPAQVADYCNPVHAPLNDTIEEATKVALDYLKAERAALSMNMLCTSPNGHHLLIRVKRDGANERLWNFTTGHDYHASL